MQVPTPTTTTRWSSRLAFDVALSLCDSSFDVDEILSFHKLTQDQLLEISADPVFQKTVQAYKDEIREKGITFRLKARLQAEELLKTSWQIIHDDATPASVKSELIRSTVKWANLEPKSDTPQESGGGARIIIQFGGNERVIADSGRTLEMVGENDSSA